MISKYQKSPEDDEDSRLTGFENFAEDYIKISNDYKTSTSEGEWETWIQNIHDEKVEASILSNGLYWVHMKNWLKAGFKRSQMLIINGEELIANPAKVILQAQDFMGLQPLIKEDNFIFDKDKGRVGYIFLIYCSNREGLSKSKFYY